ncbi:MAG: NADPH:quinone reductase-like Zn-dependent oxidoreductase, partial [Minisyncoccia bacterium]
MKAMLYTEVGGPEVFQFIDVPDPEPGAGDVIVDVAATSLNRLDLVQRAGWFQMPGFEFPHIAGMDIAGTVSAVGDAVINVSVGDRVVVDPSLAGVAENSKLAGRGDLYGDLGIIGGTVAGGYAEKCLVPASHVYIVPADMPLEHAATFPTAFLTAAHALFDVGQLQAGETVMIHAAGSGVSTAGIQLAKEAGATVLATAGTDEKCARALALGADHVANNRTTDVAGFAREVTHGAGVNMVFDHVGTALFGASLFGLGVHGRLVNCGNSSGDEATIPSLGYLFHSGIKILGSDPYR